MFCKFLSMKTKCFSIFLFFLLCNQIQAVVRYVTPAGGLSMNGSNWANAYPGTSLQTAINSSIAGDEVWVMSGTYFTTLTNNRNIYFSMINEVAIYGSFNGTETNISQRNFSCGFTSVLSAEIGIAGIDDNSYHVINNSSLNNTAILDGFTIRDANATFDLVGNDNRSLGGGMLNNAANNGTCSPTIRNCLFTALFGGGIFNHGQNNGNANPEITNCIFAFNMATSGGGGIDNFGYNGNASPVITNSIFYSNTAVGRAGGMYCWGGGGGNANPVILNSVFINNSSIDGGGIVSDRSNFAPASFSGTANPTIRNSIFWGNTASGIGPQFFLIGGAGFIATYSAIGTTNQNSPHIITGAGTGNIFTAPTFLNIADADGADNCWLTIDDGLQLLFGSVGIDVGNNVGLPAFDIRNYNRVNNAVVDMGAYELCSSVVTSGANSGAGTLRAALACAMSGSTITIDPIVTMVTLSDTLLINKNISIKGVNGSPSMLNFDLTSQNLGIRVAPTITATLEDIKLNQAGGPVIKSLLLNEGNLTLKNSSAFNPLVPPLVNSNGAGNVTIVGLVEIKAISGM